MGSKKKRNKAESQPQPAAVEKSWISAHPRVVIGILLVVCLGPFIDKAIHTDDVLFVWTGQWLQKHPADFFGFKVNWWVSALPMSATNYNPPLLSYLLAGVASLFGWNEIVLHLACLGVAFLAASGIYALAQRWCGQPLLATLIAIFTPAFLVSSSTLMCDVPMLGFWVWALVLWDRALTDDKQDWRRYAGAGALAGLAMLTKYSTITLLPLLVLLSLLRTRKAGWWLLGLAIPVLMLAGYEWITARMYRQGLFSAAVHYANTRHVEFPGGWRASLIIDLAFAGGSLLPLLFFAPWLWRWRQWLMGGIVLFGGLLVLFRLWDNVGLNSSAPDLLKNWNFLLQTVLFAAAGVYLVLFTGAEIRRRRDTVTVLLALWIAGIIYFATILNWTVNVRSFLPLVPAAAILLVRRMEAFRGKYMTAGWLLWPLIPAAAISLCLVATDYQLANSFRTIAEKIMAKYKTSGGTIWFEGHGAFQYYMEKLGGRPIDVEQSLLQPGDMVVVPEIGILTPLPSGSVGWVEHLQSAPISLMNVMGGSASGTAGFYGANVGPVPFILGNLPAQNYYVVKVFSRVQFNSQPVNPKEVQAGAVPLFQGFSSINENNLNFQMGPEAARETQLAHQLESQGRVEEAIQHYRNALNADGNNPVTLNNLAWILATAVKPGLRDGKEAVLLATRAVGLTEYRYPLFIGTLAAAYAQAGRFQDAVNTACVAEALALVTGQNDVLAANARLLARYASGLTVDPTQAP
jgi:hypothetical protein